jgi:hypothetical protein
MELPCRSFLDTTRFGVSILREMNLLDVFETSSGVLPYGSPFKILIALARACSSESKEAA